MLQSTICGSLYKDPEYLFSPSVCLLEIMESAAGTTCNLGCQHEEVPTAYWAMDSGSSSFWLVSFELTYDDCVIP